MKKEWTNYSIGDYVCYFTPLHEGVVSKNNDMAYHGRVIGIDDKKMKIEVTLEDNTKTIVVVCKETVESNNHSNSINVISDPTA